MCSLLSRLREAEGLDSLGFCAASILLRVGGCDQVRIGMHSGSMYTGVVGAIQPQVRLDPTVRDDANVTG